MITAEQIQDLVLIAESYSLILTEEMMEEQIDGCMDCGDSAKIWQIIILVEQINHKSYLEDFGSETEGLYYCLLDSIAKYTGASISVDPNSSTSGNTIVVESPLDNRPIWFDLYWGEMESDTEDGDGARYDYINPLLEGWNPSLQTGTTLLYLGLDYDMYDGGHIRLRAGRGIYDGQSIRADNFQPYDAPPLPPIEVGVALIQNNSSQSIDYNDDFAGLNALPAGEGYFKDPIVNDQSLYVQFPNETTLIYTCYNSDGSVFDTLTLNAPPSTGFTSANMLLTKRYEFIITDT